MEIDDIKNEITKAAETEQTLVINGYVTSDGDVKDYVIQLLPPSGYRDLIRDSLDELINNADTYLVDLKPADASIEEWQQAVNEQAASFKNSLSDDGKTTSARVTRPLTKVGSMYFYSDELAEEKVQTVIIKNVLVLSATNHSKDKEEKIPKGNIPKYKHMLRKYLPCSKYAAQLNLAPGKVSLVRAAQLH